jgi:type IV pilus secretin PilQ/predicted competence protein
MKIRSARIKDLASIRRKGAFMGTLLCLLAFAVPRIDNAQDKLSAARASQPQSTAVPLPGNAAKDPSGGKTAEKLSIGAITDVTVAPDDSRVTVIVATDRLLAPQEFILENPPRLVLDFPKTQNKIAFTQLPIRAASVKRLRIQQFQSMPDPIARVVFDLEEGYGTHELNTNKDSVRLVFNKAKSSVPPALTSNPKPGPAESSSNPKSSEASQSVVPARTVPPVNPPEPIKKSSTIPAASVPALNKTPSKAEAPKPAPALTDAKAHTAEATVKAPPSVPPASSSPAAGPVPDRTALARAESPKPEFVKNPTGSNAPKPANETKPLSVDKPAVVTQVVSQTPPSTLPKMISVTNSRFSGQPLTLDLIDIPLVDFFRLMADEGGINIVMDPGIKEKVSIKVVKVPWDQIFEAVMNNNNLDKQVEGSVVRIARKATLQDEAKQRESLKKANLLAADLETRIKRLNYAKAATLIKALEDQKTVRGNIVIEERTNSLIVTDLPSSINKLIPIIDALDVPQPQVEIEARIVSATRDFARAIGVQFGFVDGNLQRVTVGGPNTFGTIGGTRPSATPKNTYSAGDPITGRGSSQSSVSDSAAISTGTSSSDKGNYNVNLPSLKPFGGLGLSIGNIFDTFLLDAAITAGESKGLAKLISQPKVVAQNNSPAIVTQGLRFPVQIVANNTITVQFQNAALTLTVTPQITYEGNVVLDLKVENNTPDFGRQVNGIPSIRTSESTTRVLVSDGGTTVIGGILIDNESTTEDRVPGLGSLPLVGNLFRRNSVERSTQEVLFFVTPRIVK